MEQRRLASLLAAVVLAAVGASVGFALPVATPPNAIAYDTGEVTRGQMLRAGLALDALFVPVTTLVVTGLVTVALAALFA